MKPLYEVIRPHKDIRAGNFDESVFAADLSGDPDPDTLRGWKNA